jgi:hypothetical protein
MRKASDCASLRTFASFRAFAPLRAFASFVTSVSFVLGCAGGASAQTSELIGTRAQGMAGAFTAVADDATAAWWNPAGLATGAFFSAIIEYDHPRVLPDKPTRGVSLGFPALGLSYYRLPLSQIRPQPGSTAEASDSRQDERVLSVYGLSVGQSIGRNLVIGSTLKLASADGTQGGLDIGAMASFGRTRVGLMVRNARELHFDEDTAAPWTLKRQARAGAAYTTGSRGVIGSATLAFDADLTTLPTPAGDVRRLAVGGEAWTSTRLLGLRGGISTSTLGERQTSVSGGVSVSVRSRTFVDAQLSTGESGSDHMGWGVALRVTF